MTARAAVTARTITRQLRQLHPDVKLSTATGAHPGEFRVTLPEASFRHDGGAWGIAHILHTHLGVPFGVDGTSWHRDKRRPGGVGGAARTASCELARTASGPGQLPQPAGPLRVPR